MANPALNLAPFGRWTLRDRAAQRRLALLQGLPQIRKCAWWFFSSSFFPHLISVSLRSLSKKVKDCETTTGHPPRGLPPGRVERIGSDPDERRAPGPQSL